MNKFIFFTQFVRESVTHQHAALVQLVAYRLHGPFFHTPLCHLVRRCSFGKCHAPVTWHRRYNKRNDTIRQSLVVVKFFGPNVSSVIISCLFYNGFPLFILVF